MLPAILLVLAACSQFVEPQEAGWTMLRPLSGSVFNIKSTGKTQIGDCYRFTAKIQAPRNTKKFNKYSTWTVESEEGSQNPIYELVIDKPDIYCVTTGEKLLSGSESISIMWVYPTENIEQTTFPFNDCKVRILAQENNNQLSFKATMKDCKGHFAFWPDFARGSDSISFTEEKKYYKQEDRQIETVGELQGAISVSCSFDKGSMRSNNVDFKDLSFRVYLTQKDWEVLDVTWVFNLLALLKSD